MVIRCIMGTVLGHARHMKMPADVLVSVSTCCRTHMQFPACGIMCYARTPPLKAVITSPNQSSLCHFRLSEPGTLVPPVFCYGDSCCAPFVDQQIQPMKESAALSCLIFKKEVIAHGQAGAYKACSAAVVTPDWPSDGPVTGCVTVPLKTLPTSYKPRGKLAALFMLTSSWFKPL